MRQVEEAFVAHWSLLGGWPGARLLNEEGLTRFETPIRKLPYNGVIRTAIQEDADRFAARVADVYAEFFWVVHPSATPGDLADRLTGVGLALVERTTGMSLELDDWDVAPPAETAATLAEAVDGDGIRAYMEIVMAYWELGERDREHVERFNRHWSGPRAKGRRWLAFLDGKPIGKGYSRSRVRRAWRRSTE